MIVCNGYEWDENKESINIQKHGLPFTEAIKVFDDPFYIESYDEKHSTQTEDRFTVLGRIKNHIVAAVVHTIRGERIRIISAWKANKEEVDEYVRQFR